MKRIKTISQPCRMTLTRHLVSIADFRRWLGRPMRSFEINLVRYFESVRQRGQLILAHVYDRPGSPSSVPIILAYVEWLRHCNPTDLPPCFIGKTRQAMKDLCSHHVRKPYQTGSYRSIDNLRGGTYMIAVCFDAPHDYKKVIPVLAPIFSSEYMRGAWIFHSVGVPKRNENTPYYISRFNADFPPPPLDLKRDEAPTTIGLPSPTVLYNDSPPGDDTPDPPGNCAFRITHYQVASHLSQRQLPREQDISLHYALRICAFTHYAFLRPLPVKPNRSKEYFDIFTILFIGAYWPHRHTVPLSLSTALSFKTKKER